MLEGLGVDLTKVVISHTDRNPDRGYHREALATGAMLEYDSAFRWGAGKRNPTLELILNAAEDGLLGGIVLGMDAARSSYWSGYGGAPGLDFLLTRFTDELRAGGFDDGHLRQVFVENPARCYTFRLV